MGTSTAQLYSNLQQFRQAGVPIQEAQRALMGLTDLLTQYQYLNNQLASRAATRNFVPIDQFRALNAELSKATNVEDFAAGLVKLGHATREYWTARAGPEAGARREQELYSMYSAQGIEKLLAGLPKVTAEQRKLFADRKAAEAEFLMTSAKTAEGYDRIAKSMGIITTELLNSSGASGVWNEFVNRIAKDFEALENSMRNMNTEADKANAERKRAELLSGERDKKQEEEEAARARRRAGKRGPQSSEYDPNAGFLGRMFESEAARAARQKDEAAGGAGAPPVDTRTPAQKQLDEDWRKATATGGGAPRQHGGSAFGGRPYLVGERGPETFRPAHVWQHHARFCRD